MGLRWAVAAEQFKKNKGPVQSTGPSLYIGEVIFIIERCKMIFDRHPDKRGLIF